MRPETPCPHPVHLRTLVHEPARLPMGADDLRAHLAECESCRTEAARLETDADLPNTLAEPCAGPTRPAPRPCGSLDEPADGGDGAQPTIELAVGAPPEADGSHRAVDIGETIYERSRPGTDERRNHLQPSDPAPVTNRRQASHPAATGEFLPDADSSKGGLDYSVAMPPS